jgi:hypothetical protein
MTKQRTLNLMSFFKDMGGKRQPWNLIWAYRRDHTTVGGPINRDNLVYFVILVQF